VNQLDAELLTLVSGGQTVVSNNFAMAPLSAQPGPGYQQGQPMVTYRMDSRDYVDCLRLVGIDQPGFLQSTFSPSSVVNNQHRLCRDILPPR